MATASQDDAHTLCLCGGGLAVDRCCALDWTAARRARRRWRIIVRVDPNNLPATQALALRLFSNGALVEAERHARNAVRIAPLDIQLHNLMGMIMTEAQRPHVGKHHDRRATNRRASPARSCSPTSPGT